MKSQYGNYVVQKAIEVLQAREDPECLLRDYLLPSLRRRLSEIVDKKLRVKWDQIIKDGEQGKPRKRQDVTTEEQTTLAK